VVSIVAIEGAPEDVVFVLPPDMAKMIQDARTMDDWEAIIAEVKKRPHECAALRLPKP